MRRLIAVVALVIAALLGSTAVANALPKHIKLTDSSCVARETTRLIKEEGLERSDAKFQASRTWSTTGRTP